MLNRSSHTALLSICALLCSFVIPGLRAAESISFNRDVRPILSENCFACHGFDKAARKAKLRLDVRDDNTADVLEADADGSSELVTRIFSRDPEEQMPPPESKHHLKPEEKKILRDWIAAGAAYESHWAWNVPQKPELETDERAEIDFYVVRRLIEKGLKPSPTADDARLVRRLYLDLIGLPPTATQAAGFSRDRYSAIVDELLNSPHFGEKWAIMWLDLARYADTVGYHGDQPVSVSPYRDYVINAFNSNKPYDVFTREQIAGDLIPGAGEEQLIASGFNRLNMTTEEGGSQPKEYLAKYAGDRVRTTSTVFMGATLGCAECHDHKFDPYTTKDFYSFAAFFADVQEVGVYSARSRPPEMVVREPEVRKLLTKAQSERDAARGELLSAADQMGAQRGAWAARLAGEIASLERTDSVWLEDSQPIGSQLAGAWVPQSEDVYSGKVAWAQTAPAGRGVQHYFKGAVAPITLARGDRFFFYVKLDPANPPGEIMMQVHSEKHGGWSHRAFWGADKIDYGGIGKKNAQHWPMGGLPAAGEWARLEVSAEAIGFVAGQEIDGMSFDQFGGRALWDQAGVVMLGGSEELRALPEGVAGVLKKPTAEWNSKDHDLIAAHHRGIAPELAPQRERMARAEKLVAELEAQGTKTLITVSQEPRMIRVLPRGNWLDDSGEIVQPAVPEFLAEPSGVAEGDRRLTRLDLADWLVSRDNPLTARVFVNRVWKQLFGTGITKVLDDVGSQGEWPIHPELLDWLAVDFMESGWDVKRLIKQIVMSQTYQQSSKPSPALREIDPYNRLLARQSSFRLDAELVRDQFLSVSGQLVDELGGRSVFPYQPPGLYRHLNFPRREYQASTDQNQWRRGVYTHWQRTFLHPMLKAFDAPSRDECAADRPRSNTPVQALALLNDPSQVESARVFAGRILDETGGHFHERLNWAFRESLTRTPSAAEVAVLEELYSAHLKKFRADPEAAKQYLDVGISINETAHDVAEHAAWMSVTRAIFNLHEIITRY